MECMKFQMFTDCYSKQITNNKSGLAGQWFFKVKSIWCLQTFDYAFWFESCKDRCLTQRRSSGVVGQARRTPKPLQKKKSRTKPNFTYEPNWLNWVRLTWSTFDPGLTHEFHFILPLNLFMNHVTFSLCANFLVEDFLLSSVSIFFFGCTILS